MFVSFGSILVLLFGILLIVGAGLYIIRFLSLAKELKSKKASEDYQMIVDWRLKNLNE